MGGFFTATTTFSPVSIYINIYVCICIYLDVSSVVFLCNNSFYRTARGVLDRQSTYMKNRFSGFSFFLLILMVTNERHREYGAISDQSWVDYTFTTNLPV